MQEVFFFIEQSLCHSVAQPHFFFVSPMKIISTWESKSLWNKAVLNLINKSSLMILQMHFKWGTCKGSINISWLINFIQDDQSVLLKFYKSMVGHYYNSHLCYRVSLILLLSQMGFFFHKAEMPAFWKNYR